MENRKYQEYWIIKVTERYQVKARLGRGGIGAVHRCLDRRMGREVAMKRLLPLEETDLNEPADYSLEREALALSAFQHPNVVTILEFSEDDHGPFVVTELIEGDTIKHIIKKCGPLDLPHFYAMVNQTLDVLIAAQDMNLLHRDLKPANIMVQWLPSGKFHSKILDFGLSKFSAHASKQTLDLKGSFLGSIDYVAPEQFKRIELDHRTDLYSIACVYYFCLTGRSPFIGKNPSATMKRHLNHDVKHVCDRRPDLPLAVGDWLMQMMSRWPKDRPQNAIEAAARFDLAKDHDLSPAEFVFNPLRKDQAGTAPVEPGIKVTPRPDKPHHSLPETNPAHEAQITQPIRIRENTGPSSSPTLSTRTVQASSPQQSVIQKKSARNRFAAKWVGPMVGAACLAILVAGFLAIWQGNLGNGPVPENPWNAAKADGLRQKKVSPLDAGISEGGVGSQKP